MPAARAHVVRYRKWQTRDPCPGTALQRRARRPGPARGTLAASGWQAATVTQAAGP